MRCVAILCGLCLMLSTAAASGTPFRGSSIAHSALNQARAINATLLGHRAVEATVGKNLPGTAEAFAFRARRGGTAVSITVYLGARDRATRLFAGLYSSRHGHPESLLTAGSLRSPKAGRWNRVAVGSVHVRSGSTYWLAFSAKSARSTSATEIVGRARGRGRRGAGRARWQGPGPQAQTRAPA